MLFLIENQPKPPATTPAGIKRVFYKKRGILKQQFHFHLFTVTNAKT